MKTLASLMLLAATLLAGTPVRAEQVVRVGGYDVHYVVIGTTFLAPDIAQRYGIERAKDRAFINITVLRNGVSVAAHIEGIARDLLERRIALPFREVKERNSVYYIASLQFSDQEHWRFELKVTPAGSKEPMAVKFAQQIYVE